MNPIIPEVRIKTKGKTSNSGVNFHGADRKDIEMDYRNDLEKAQAEKKKNEQERNRQSEESGWRMSSKKRENKKYKTAKGFLYNSGKREIVNDLVVDYTQSQSGKLIEIKEAFNGF